MDYSELQKSTINLSKVQQSTEGTEEYKGVQLTTVNCIRVQWSSVEYRVVKWSVQWSTESGNTIEYNGVEYNTVEQSGV